ncbi:hypothetical protein MS3_00003311 [Schistosoma haematobium]|uniref:Coiled-coil domain-containing protein 169 n=2 Tax=Schistosoma haematobium TaxID=6185 RepID=A0A922LP87_SCHHA|nr:hypothetical protein MS3_00003311 [Schistosoma haematobium]KAH9590757.1 hypothetical protein MS3_00003311 [Schistosoma haematobium]CAH8661431.1 unnamed protein product [Schistosoma haematobium]
MSFEIINTVDKLTLSDQIEQEKISLNLLRQTNCKLEESIDILEDQLASIEDEDNEWKTRYLIQKEMNDYYKRAFFFCDQQIPKAKALQRTINRAVRRGSKLSSYMDLDEDSVQELEDYRTYIIKLCRELESRIDQEGKAYYWATEIRKRALIELNYTYIPAPVSKYPVEKKEDESDKLVRKTQNRTFNSKYGLGSKTSGVKKLPPMHF